MGLSGQSRVLNSDKSRSYSEIEFQENKHLLDAELNLAQKNIVLKLKELLRNGLKFDSGFITTSAFSAGAGAVDFKMGSSAADINRANVNGFIVDLLGTGSANDYENIVTMTAKPGAGS